MDIIIDANFKSLMPQLTTNEYETLEQSLINEGCRDALVLWEETLIDGYNRYEICQKHGIEFKTTALEFESREDVVNWIIDNQLGRRNLTTEQKNYLIGMKYKKEKQTVGRPQKKCDQNEHIKSSAKKIGAEYKVSAPTVRRAEKYADAVDTIAENVDTEVRQEILNKKIESTAKDVLELAKTPPETQREVIEKARTTGLNLAAAHQEVRYDDFRLRIDDDSEDESVVICGEKPSVEDSEVEESIFFSEVPDWQEYVERQKWIDEYAFALAKADDVDTLHRLRECLKRFTAKIEDLFKDVLEELE